MRLDYRVCAYNHTSHGGVHVHVPYDGPVVATVSIRDLAEAILAVRGYMDHHDTFDIEVFRKEVEGRSSKSRNG